MVYDNHINYQPHNRLDSESQSEHESNFELRDNNEEGKSLIDDFNHRVPSHLSESHQHDDSVDSEAQEELGYPESESRNRIIFPPIISEESHNSQSNDFMNVDSRNIRLANPLNSSNRNGSSVSEENSHQRVEFLQFHQQSSKENSEEVKAINLDVENSNQSAANINPLKPYSLN